MRSAKILFGALLLAALGSTGEAHAQRALRGQVAIGCNFGTTDGLLLRGRSGDYRFWGGVELVRYNRNRTYWNFGAELLRKDYPYRGYVGLERVPLAQFTAEAGYNLPLVSDRGRNVALVCGLSGLLGYETSGWGVKTLHDGAILRSRDAFLWGVAATATVEGYLSDRVVVLVRLRERCMPGSPTGAFHTQVGIGLRIVIN